MNKYNRVIVDYLLSSDQWEVGMTDNLRTWMKLLKDPQDYSFPERLPVWGEVARVAQEVLDEKT